MQSEYAASHLPNEALLVAINRKTAFKYINNTLEFSLTMCFEALMSKTS